jgi:hypothetical protein
MAIFRFQYYGQEGKTWEMPLPPESIEALMQEIRDYECDGKISESASHSV